MVSLNDYTHYHKTLATTIFVTLGLSLVLHIYQKKRAITVIEQAEAHMVNIIDDRTKKIEDYLDNKKTALSIFTTNAIVQHAFKNTAHDGQEQLKLLVKSYSEAQNIENILFIRTDGSLIYAQKKPEVFKANLLDMPYDTTNLGKAFKQTLLSLTPTFSVFSHDFFTKKPSLYLIDPVYENKILIGFVAAQIDHQELYNLAQDYLGLGETGEIFFTNFFNNITHGTRIRIVRISTNSF